MLVWLDCHDIWHEKCYQHFFQECDKNVWPILKQIFEIFCGWFEYPQLKLGGTFEAPMIFSIKTEGS
jgi:predicted secreted protein